MDAGASFIFLSYTRRDLPFAGLLAAELRSRDLEVWLDLERLHPGGDWASMIDAAIDAASAVVLVASRTSVASPECERECGRARRRGTRVVVAAIERLTVPEWLRDCPVVDLRVSELPPWDRVAAAARNSLGPAESSASVPYRVPSGSWGFLALWMAVLFGLHVNAVVSVAQTARRVVDDGTPSRLKAVVAAHLANPRPVPGLRVRPAVRRDTPRRQPSRVIPLVGRRTVGLRYGELWPRGWA